MIQFEGVSLAREGRAILSDLSFALPDGAFAAVIGANGAGKSSLAKLVNGLLKPSAGSVMVNGADTRRTRTSELARTVGFLFQNPDRQLCRDTVAGEIRFGLEQVLSDGALIERRVQEAVESFGFDPAANPLTASRGERQRVALASTLALKPRVLVLDEPTTGLDGRACDHIMHCVMRLNRETGATVLMISHDMDLVADCADRVLVLSEGRLLADGGKGLLRDGDLLLRASLLPPQIYELSTRLGPDFQGVETSAQMADAIESRCIR